MKVTLRGLNFYRIEIDLVQININTSVNLFLFWKWILRKVWDCLQVELLLECYKTNQTSFNISLYFVYEYSKTNQSLIHIHITVHLHKVDFYPMQLFNYYDGHIPVSLQVICDLHKGCRIDIIIMLKTFFVYLPLHFRTLLYIQATLKGQILFKLLRYVIFHTV